MDTITYAVADHIATITLNRPDKLNAFTTPMMSELIAAFDMADADDDVRCVILTGAGRAYCSGADISAGGDAFADLAKDPARQALRHGEDLYRDGGGMVSLRIFDSLKPVIAAINGAAVGVGITMLLAADIRIAAKGARFGFVFSRRGIVPEAASTWFLPRLVGVSTALDWCLAGKMVSDVEGLEAGLVKSLHEPEDLMPAARAIAAEIVGQAAPVSAVLIRQMIWRNLGVAHPMAAHRADSRAIRSRAQAGDVREGVAAFKDKRPPVFTDRVSTDLPDIWPEWDAPTFR